MRRSDSLWRLGRTGSAGILTVARAASSAEAALPTGGMLLPRPRGPARADLPAHTAIDVFRIPSATAYGLVGGDALRTSDANTAATDFAVEPSKSPRATEAAAPESDATPITERPLIRPRVTADGGGDNPFSLPAPAAETEQASADPFADLSAEATPITDAGTEPAPQIEAVPPDAWETEAAPAESGPAVYAGLKGICPVTLREERKVVEPRSELFTEFEGRRYEFATPEAKAAFEIDPTKYAPVLGGRDVVLTAAGAEEAIGTLKHAGFYRERLYLFQTEETCKTFYENPRRFLVNE
jgi:YHS domain-containing protein